jgi:hypothetical protein
MSGLGGSDLAKLGVVVQESGTTEGAVQVFNFVGATVSVAGAVATITSSGGGSSWTELEVNFGTIPVFDTQFTITDAAINSSSKVIVVPSGKTAPGRPDGDWQWDGATFAARAGSGSATCYAIFHPGPIVGRRYIQYQVI